ncbi:NB-ARC domain-containing protein [Candidatus Viridilinea mediisalina]|nr:NB-ARC domain-containing protein [Candidatus Viridilinea mediisalina]
MPKRNETFGRLLKIAINSIATYEGKTAPCIEEELAEQVGLAGSALQRYKSGYLPPEPRTIEVIAEAAIRRGLFAREWLERFLHAARYPQIERLVEQLCPLGPARPRPPRVYENLPAPTYSQFVMREQAFAEVLDGLQQRSAAVLIVGMGGNGKTSLAREVAAACLHDAATHPRCDALVWVSDKDRPGTTNLSVVLDTVARTLNYPGFTQFAHSEKQHEVEQLLRRQRVLLVVDNFETINDSALLTWLLRLPEPSKALITTREYRREWRSSWPVELRGMSEAEAWTLVEQRLRQLRIEQLVSARQQLDPLLMATSGNPKAITMTLGLIKYERRPLQEVVDDLYAARGELFDDLFARAWALLDEAARRILLVATFFPTSASADALSASADAHGFAFDRERLVDLALLDVYQSDLGSPVRYALHPLVRAFATTQLLQQPALEREARDRWVIWYLKLVRQIGYCPNDVDKLSLLDMEQDNTFWVMRWSYQQQRYDEFMELCALDGASAPKTGNFRSGPSRAQRSD